MQHSCSAPLHGSRFPVLWCVIDNQSSPPSPSPPFQRIPILVVCRTATTSDASAGLFPDGTSGAATSTYFSVACGCDVVIISPPDNVFPTPAPATATSIDNILDPVAATVAPDAALVPPEESPTSSAADQVRGTPEDKDDTTAIVAGVLSASAAVAALIVIGAVCLRRRRRASASKPAKPGGSSAGERVNPPPPPYGASSPPPPESGSASGTAGGQRAYLSQGGHETFGARNSAMEPVTASTGNISTVERAELAQAFQGRDPEMGAFVANTSPQRDKRGGVEPEVARRRPSGGGVGVARAVMEAARDLAQQSPILGVSEAATLVSILVDLVSDGRDSLGGGEERLKRCRSIVTLLQRASKVLGKVRRWDPKKACGNLFTCGTRILSDFMYGRRVLHRAAAHESLFSCVRMPCIGFRAMTRTEKLNVF